MKKCIVFLIMLSLCSCNNEEKNMKSIKSSWAQLVNSKTIKEEKEAIHQLSEISKKHNFSFALYIIEISGKRIHYNDFKNQKVASISMDLDLDGSELTLDNWKPLDINNISLFFLE